MMKINRTRPVVAFLVVAVVCGFVIAQGLRASALTVVVSGRAPVAFAGGVLSGALFGPVFSLRVVDQAPVVRPVLTDRSGPSVAAPAVAREVSTGIGPARPGRPVVPTAAPVPAPVVNVVPVVATTPAKTRPAKQRSGAKVHHASQARADQPVRAQSTVDVAATSAKAPERGRASSGAAAKTQGTKTQGTKTQGTAKAHGSAKTEGSAAQSQHVGSAGNGKNKR